MPANPLYQEMTQRVRDSMSVLNRAPEAHTALDLSCTTMRKLAEHMSTMDYANEKPCAVCNRKGISPEAAAKTLSYVAKVVNETTRLLEFAKGNADSRTEVKGLEELLKHLSKERFEQVCAWIEEAEVVAPTALLEPSNDPH